MFRRRLVTLLSVVKEVLILQSSHIRVVVQRELMMRLHFLFLLVWIFRTLSFSVRLSRRHLHIRRLLTMRWTVFYEKTQVSVSPSTPTLVRQYLEEWVNCT